MRMSVVGGLWIITDKFGSEYEVLISEVSDYNGFAFSGEYRYNGKEIGCGCFPLKDIRSMRKIGD